MASLALQATRPRLLVAPSKHQWLPTRVTSATFVWLFWGCNCYSSQSAAKNRRVKLSRARRNGEIRTGSHCAGTGKARQTRGTALGNDREKAHKLLLSVS